MHLKSRYLSALTFTLAFLLAAGSAHASGYIRYETIPGEVLGPDGGADWFLVDSFSFGVKRERPIPTARGGTEDINIGVGELQECTISKSMDRSSASLAQYAINGNSLGSCEICLAEDVPAGETPLCYAHYVMERCFVRTLTVHMANTSTSGDADDRPVEEVAFYYNKIAFGFMSPDNNMSWDKVRHRPWAEGLEWLFEFGRR